MKILCLYDRSGPKYHRILLPSFLMDGVDLTVNGALLEDQVKDCDILFFNRVISNIALDTVLKWREKYGFKMVVDFDDHWRLDPEHYLYEAYKNYQASELMEEYIKVSDAVFVTHERLRNEVLPFNKNVHVLPNAIPRWEQFLTDRKPDDCVRLFWAGGVTHKRDIHLLKRPLELIKRDRVKFILGGYSDNNPEWKVMAKWFTTNSSYNTEVIEALPVDEYYRMYSKCDISLIPLVHSPFNTHKSNLKILEAANIGAPVVVSRVHPYLDFPEDLVNYVDLHNTWYSQITKLINDPELRREQGEMLREYCNEHYNFIKINEERKQILECVMKTESSLKAAATS